MRVWILQTGEPLHIDDPNLRPMRGMNLSNELVKQGHEVWFISSDFDHFSKTHRHQSDQIIKVNSNLNLWLIKSRGYKRHVGIQRLLDHAQLGFKLRKIYSRLPVPDVAFIGYPPIESAWSLSRWLTKNNIPYFVDAKDAWPDIFVHKFPPKIQILAKLIFIPYFLISNQVFKDAKGIIGPSEEFLKWGLSKAKRESNKFDLVAPLTSPNLEPSSKEILEAETFWQKKNLGRAGKPIIFFVGSLTESFDFQPIIEIAKSGKFQVVIAGEGPLKQYFISLSEMFEDLVVPGWINQAQLYVLAHRSKFSLVPLINRFDFNMSTTNKLVDSLRLGVPVLSSNKNITNRLLLPLGIGAGYDSENLSQVIERLLREEAKYKLMKQRTREIYEKEFDYTRKYSELISTLESALPKTV